MNHVLWLLCHQIYYAARFVNGRVALLDFLDENSERVEEPSSLNLLGPPDSSFPKSYNDETEKATERTVPEQPSIPNLKPNELLKHPQTNERTQDITAPNNGSSTTLDYTTANEVGPRNQIEEDPVVQLGVISDTVKKSPLGSVVPQLIENPPEDIITSITPLKTYLSNTPIETHSESSFSNASQKYSGRTENTEQSHTINTATEPNSINELTSSPAQTTKKLLGTSIAPVINSPTEQSVSSYISALSSDSTKSLLDVPDAISSLGKPPQSTIKSTSSSPPRANPIQGLYYGIHEQTPTIPLETSISPTKSSSNSIDKNIESQEVDAGSSNERRSILSGIITSPTPPIPLLPSPIYPSVSTTPAVSISYVAEVLPREKELPVITDHNDQNQRAIKGAGNLIEDLISGPEPVETAAHPFESKARNPTEPQIQKPSLLSIGSDGSNLQNPDWPATRSPLPNTNNGNHSEGFDERDASVDADNLILGNIVLDGKLGSNPVNLAPNPTLDNASTAKTAVISPFRDAADNTVSENIILSVSNPSSTLIDMEANTLTRESGKIQPLNNLETESGLPEILNSKPTPSVEELPSNSRLIVDTQDSYGDDESNKPPNEARSQNSTTGMMPKVAIESSTSSSAHLNLRLRKPPAIQNANQRDVILYNASKPENPLVTESLPNRVKTRDKAEVTVLDIKTTVSAPAQESSSPSLRMYVRGTPLIKKAQTEGINPEVIVIGGRNRFPTDDGLPSELSQSERMIHKVIKYAASTFAGITVAFLLFFHFVLTDRSLCWQNAFWAPNSWELIYYLGYLQQMSSVSQLLLLKTPYFVWEYTDSFAWTGLLIQSDLGLNRGHITRRLQQLILGGIVSFGDRLAIHEDKILYEALIGFSIVFATLLVAFCLFNLCAKYHSDKEAKFMQTSNSPYRRISIRTAGLSILFWYCSLFPISMYASFEMSMEYIAGEIYPALFVAIALVLVVCIGGLIISGYVIMHATETDLREDNMLALWGSLYSELTYRSRMFFIIIGVFQITLGICVGFFDNDPGQMVAVMLLRLSYFIAVFSFNPYADALMVKAIYIVETLMIINHSLAFAFLSTTNMSTSTRYGIGDAFITINSVVILLWFIRQLIVFAAYVRSWSAKSHVEHVIAGESYMCH
ncbi:unnamed protein product [Albugo candida]|uniref:TRP C-terminal domain-containing protein n=1 Tax=Albugo candida TaxID=65357 RepID=A0A024GUU8_9STRA|nr:unnamed protein product [Albugo candida]|eukprot:CCI50375.1 unnamed protein product [Albugo candida]